MLRGTVVGHFWRRYSDDPIIAETISHGVEHFGPIVIQVPVIIAITDVLSQTIALLAELIDADDEDEDEA